MASSIAARQACELCRRRKVKVSLIGPGMAISLLCSFIPSRLIGALLADLAAP